MLNIELLNELDNNNFLFFPRKKVKVFLLGTYDIGTKILKKYLIDEDGFKRELFRGALLNELDRILGSDENVSK